MVGSLYKIQPDVQSTAEVIAAALDVETEIVDDESRVLGATGRVRGLLLSQRADSHISHFVIKNKHPFVLANPGSHILCEPCVAKDECYFTAGIYYPITLQEKCHGIISLVGFNERQKNILMENETKFIDFIAKMADLLSPRFNR